MVISHRPKTTQTTTQPPSEQSKPTQDRHQQTIGTHCATRSTPATNWNPHNPKNNPIEIAHQNRKITSNQQIGDGKKPGKSPVTNRSAMGKNQKKKKKKTQQQISNGAWVSGVGRRES